MPSHEARAVCLRHQSAYLRGVTAAGSDESAWELRHRTKYVLRRTAKLDISVQLLPTSVCLDTDLILTNIYDVHIGLV